MEGYRRKWHIQKKEVSEGNRKRDIGKETPTNEPTQLDDNTKHVGAYPSDPSDDYFSEDEEDPTLPTTPIDIKPRAQNKRDQDCTYRMD